MAVPFANVLICRIPLVPMSARLPRRWLKRRRPWLSQSRGRDADDRCVFA